MFLLRLGVIEKHTRTKSDINPKVKWVVIADGHLNLPCGFYGYKELNTHFTTPENNIQWSKTFVGTSVHDE